MDDGLLLQSAEGLEDPTLMRHAGEIWNSLQDMKEEVSQELLAEGPMCHSDTSGLTEDEVAEAGALELELAHRQRLEEQLSAITHAQDRVIEGSYGKCEYCGAQINIRRLDFNPSASLCVDCQRAQDGEQTFRTL